MEAYKPDTLRWGFRLGAKKYAGPQAGRHLAPIFTQPTRISASTFTGTVT